MKLLNKTRKSLLALASSLALANTLAAPVNTFAADTQTLHGILICGNCRNDGYAIAHSRGCCLMDNCAISGYGVLIPQLDNKSYKFYKLDEKGNDEAFKLLNELDVNAYLSVDVTGDISHTAGTYKYKDGANELSVNYDGSISNITSLEYNDTHSTYTANAVDFKNTKVKVEPVLDQKYTGKAIKPKLTIKDGNYTLIAGEDYSVLYKDNTNIGTATAVITGTGAFYKGTLKITYNITATGASTTGTNTQGKTTVQTNTKNENADTKYKVPAGY